MLPRSERQRLGRYTLLAHLASGGMANLYLARFTGVDGFEKQVAIKQIHRYLLDQVEFIQMFIDEARIASRIAHPNVVQVLELGEADGVHFMAMEYVEGENLTAILRRGALPERICVRVVASAAAGLHAAHELKNKGGELLGVVHRDVSPHNILVSYEGATKVTDFGIARAKDNLHVTTEGMVKGKFSYMAPEHARGESIDRRADVYALGVVLYEITTGRRTFQGESDVEVVNRVMRGEITPPSELVPDYSPDLEAIVMQALSPATAHRFQSAEELQGALEAYLARSGPPLLESAVAAHLKTRFADRIAAKQELLRQCELLGEGGRSSAELRPLAAPAPLPRRSRLASLVILLVTAVLCASVIGGVLWYKARRRAEQQPAPVRPQLVVFAVKATPAEAQIAIDGVLVANPHRESRPRSTGVAIVRVTAPGHIPQEHEVPLSAGCDLSVALRPTPAPSARPDAALAPPAPKKAPPRKKRPRGKKDEDLFGDPYGR